VSTGVIQQKKNYTDFFLYRFLGCSRRNEGKCHSINWQTFAITPL